MFAEGVIIKALAFSQSFFRNNQTVSYEQKNKYKSCRQRRSVRFSC